MEKILDLQAIARGDQLLAIALNNPNLKLPSYKDTEMEHKNNETRVIGIRFPVDLLEWIDSYSRIAAVNSESRITRNATVIGFLETMKALMEYQSKTQWGGKSHQQMIKELLESGQNREETQQHEVTP